MAGNWIKVRWNLSRDARVLAMAEHVGLPDSDLSARAVSFMLVEVWGLVMEQGERDGDDALLMHANTATSVYPLRGTVTLYVNGVRHPGLEFLGYHATTGEVYQWPSVVGETVQVPATTSLAVPVPIQTYDQRPSMVQPTLSV